MTAIASLAYLSYEFVSGLLTRRNHPATPETAQPQASPKVKQEVTPSPAPSPSPKSCGAMALDYRTMGIRQLRIIARDRGVRGAARLTKAQCLDALR